MVENNARFGFTLQSIICKKYGILPDSREAINQFKASFDSSFVGVASKICESVFSSLKVSPVKCTTFTKGVGNEDIPYNFILSDNSTLSIRTNMNGCKIAPRRVGQAGFEKLNQYFGEIYGKEIETQIDIKHLITEKIDQVLPIFFENLFDADYILWVYSEDGIYKTHLIRGDLGVNIDFVKSNFSFTRNFYEWTESTTLKYKDVSIAEIQVHKARSFKFRFVMKNVIPLLVQKEINTETLGITAEKTICDKFKLKYPDSFLTRYSVDLQSELSPVIDKAFKHLPDAIKHTGSEKGERGGESKCSYDFVLEGNKTLSLKTNTGKMVCPPEVGQPGAATCYLYFKKYINESRIDGMIFKRMVYEKIDQILPVYIEHMFDSDFLLWILKRNDSYQFKILEKNYSINFKWKKELFSFSKPRIEDWNESNTLKYDGISIGEFQVHKNRDCYKFRFNLENFIKVVENYEK